jgi:TfoX/Sxy family transcriptional regulator of competence genes
MIQRTQYRRKAVAKEEASKANRKWRPAPDELVRTFEQALQQLPEATRRKMFGYPCAFAGGHMFTGIHQESMFLRLSDEDRAAFLELDGASRFEPSPGRVMHEYVVVPEAMLGSEEQLDLWFQKAFAYAKSLPPRPPKKRRSKRAR